MTAPAERMKMMRQRRRARGLRELRLVVADARSRVVQRRVSVVVCQLTSELAEAPDFRVTIEPKPENGLRLKSQVMADKPVTVRRDRIGQKIGRLGNQDMARLGIALAFVFGLAG